MIKKIFSVIWYETQKGKTDFPSIIQTSKAFWTPVVWLYPNNKRNCIKVYLNKK